VHGSPSSTQNPQASPALLSRNESELLLKNDNPVTKKLPHYYYFASDSCNLDQEKETP